MSKVIDEVATITTQALKEISLKLGIQKSEEVVEEVKSEEQKFEQITVGEGEKTVVFEADVFEAGQAIFAITGNDERVPVPVGEYPSELGIIVVAEEGVIAEIRAEEEEEESPAENVEEAPVEQESVTPKKIVEAITTETHFSAEQLSEIDSKFEALKEELFAKLVEEFKNAGEVVEEVELSKQEKVEPAKHTMSKQEKKEFKTYKQDAKKDTRSNLIQFFNNRK